MCLILILDLKNIQNDILLHLFIHFYNLHINKHIYQYAFKERKKSVG